MCRKRCFRARGRGRNGGVPSATASASHDVISGHHVHRCIQVDLAVRHLAVRLSGGGLSLIPRL